MLGDNCKNSCTFLVCVGLLMGSCFTIKSFASCSQNLGIINTIYLSIGSSYFMIQCCCQSWEIYKKKWLSSVLSLICFSFQIYALIVSVKILINEPTCGPYGLIITGVVIYNLASFVSLCILCCWLLVECGIRKLKREIDTIYENMSEPKADCEGFLSNNPKIVDLMDKLRVKPKVEIIFFDFFSRQFNREDDILPDTTCKKCLKRFKIGDLMLVHPKCHHKFHHEEYKDIFNRELDGIIEKCGVCKTPTNSNMVIEINRRAKEGEIGLGD